MRVPAVLAQPLPTPPPPTTPIDWDAIGSYADWTTALIALLALAAAAAAAWATLQTNRAQQKTLELQRKQFEEAQAKTRRLQAEGVSFWLDAENLELCIINASNLPIYDADIPMPHPIMSIHRQVVVPTGNDPLRLKYEPTPNFDHAIDKFNGGKLQMRFYDAIGIRWTRSEIGPLTEESH